MKIDVILPGLLDQLPAWQQSYQEISVPSSLEKSLSVAKKTKTNHRGFEATISDLLDPKTKHSYCVTPPEINQSMAPLHAEFVHLRADIGEIVLYDSSELDLTYKEVEDLTSLVEAHVADEGAHFQTDNDGNSYLLLPDDLEVTTTPTSEVCGQNIFNHLPQGQDKHQLHRLINELQMLLHNAPTNVAREAEGKPAANGLWLWRSRASAAAEAGQGLIDTTVISSGGYPQTLARYHGAAHQPLARNWEDTLALITTQRALLVLPHLKAPSAYDDLFRWQEQLKRLTDDWLQPAQIQCNHGELEEVNINTCAGHRFSLRPQRLWHRWMKPQKLTEHL